jgi:hypothetical protein
MSGYKMATMSRTEMANHSKTDLRFWQDAVFRHVRRVSEKTYEDSDYSVRMQLKASVHPVA